MKFGLLYITDYRPEVHGPAAQYYGELLEQIEYAEELGFDGILFAEHYVGGYAFPSPPVFASAVAQRTNRIRLGTGVALLPLCNPIRTAEEYAMLDVLSGGRLDFGVGRGVLKAEYELFGVDEAESQGRYHEALDVIVKAWTWDVVSHQGEFYAVHDVEPLPKPIQRPPPIWAACAISPESFAWAGRMGFHAMTVPFAYPKRESLQKLLDVYWSAFHEAGHDPAGQDILGVYHLVVGDDDEEAHAIGRPAFFRYWDFFAELDRKATFRSGDYKRYKGGLSHLFEKMSWDELDESDCVMFGSPDRLVRRLERAQEDYGLTYASFEVNFGGLSHEQAMRTLEGFARDVMPRFR